MRRLSLAIAALLLTAAPAFAQSISLPIDQSRRIALPAAAADVAIGNSAVADVTVVDARNLLITGKGYGTTNVLAMDRTGRTIFEREIVVSSPEGRVTVYRGATPQEFACEVHCERAALAQAAPAPANP